MSCSVPEGLRRLWVILFIAFLGNALLLNYTSTQDAAFYFACMCVCLSVHVCANVWGGQKTVRDPLGLELQVSVSFLM